MKKLLFIAISFLHTSQAYSYSLIFEKGDICDSPVSCIVNAANSELIAGGGVCGAIFKAAGAQELQAACDFYCTRRK